MLGWLAKKGENARVYMCIKEVKWDLERADGLRRATLLLLAQFFRVGMTDERNGGFNLSYFDRPLDHTRADLVALYTGLEHIRNNNNVQREQIERSLARFGGMPEFAVEQSKNTNRGIEIWMCTVGSGIVPDRRDEVRQIWTMLSEGLPFVREAMRRLQEVAKRTEDATGTKASQMFEALSPEQWIAAADFVPTAFRS